MGRLVVHRDVANSLVRVFERLYAARVAIRRIVPVDAYGASDGTRRWSEHAYGRAVDVNPIENPYVTPSGATSHPASVPYLRRQPARPGTAVEGGPLVRAFDAADWSWGGRWSGAKDYQHFSASGR